LHLFFSSRRCLEFDSAFLPAAAAAAATANVCVTLTSADKNVLLCRLGLILLSTFAMSRRRYKRPYHISDEYIDRAARVQRIDYFPITKGEVFCHESCAVKLSKKQSLQSLSAKAVAKLFPPGVGRSLAFLRGFPLPPLLIRMVHPFLTLTMGEWKEFFIYEHFWPSMPPDGERMERLKKHHDVLYLFATKGQKRLRVYSDGTRLPDSK
jgi:hypothetical protein